MTVKYLYPKDPDETVAYSLDWLANSNMARGDTIVSTSTKNVTGGISVLNHAIASNRSGHTTARVSGGTAGTTASWTVVIVTEGGETLEQTVQLKIASR